MPSVSGKQHRFMEMVAHDPAAAKRVGVPQLRGVSTPHPVIAASSPPPFPSYTLPFLIFLA